MIDVPKGFSPRSYLRGYEDGRKSIGQLGGRKGGPSRMALLDADQRRELARKANIASLIVRRQNRQKRLEAKAAQEAVAGKIESAPEASTAVAVSDQSS